MNNEANNSKTNAIHAATSTLMNEIGTFVMLENNRDWAGVEIAGRKVKTQIAFMADTFNVSETYVKALANNHYDRLNKNV